MRLVHGESIDWRTPSGNPTNLLFLLPLAAIHAVVPPSFFALRLTALASGLLALAANYVLCRKTFDEAHGTRVNVVVGLAADRHCL